MVDHWRRLHIFNVTYPNEPAVSVFEKKLNAEEIVKKTISSGDEVDSGTKNGLITKTLKNQFDFKVRNRKQERNAFL